MLYDKLKNLIEENVSLLEQIVGEIEKSIIERPEKWKVDFHLGYTPYKMLSNGKAGVSNNGKVLINIKTGETTNIDSYSQRLVKIVEPFMREYNKKSEEHRVQKKNEGIRKLLNFFK